MATRKLIIFICRINRVLTKLYKLKVWKNVGLTYWQVKFFGNFDLIFYS